MSARERLRLVVAESALLGVVGSVLGLALGHRARDGGLALAGGRPRRRLLPGRAPRRCSSAPARRWSTARSASRRPSPAAGCRRAARSASRRRRRSRACAVQSGAFERPWLGPALLLAGVLLALAPAAVRAAARGLRVGRLPAARRHRLRAGRRWRCCCAASRRRSRRCRCWRVERARQQRHSATIAVAGVVASLALSVALTVMVASFRDSVTRWLDTVLPADLYVRGAASISAGDSVFLAPAFVQAVTQLPGVARAEAQRVTQVQLAPDRPAVALIARPLGRPGAARCRWSATLLPAEPGRVGGLRERGDGQPVRRHARERRSLLPLPDGRVQAAAGARRVARLRAPGRRAARSTPPTTARSAATSA